jgi:hypothetical protein
VEASVRIPRLSAASVALKTGISASPTGNAGPIRNLLCDRSAPIVASRRGDAKASLLRKQPIPMDVPIGT